jgi:hypothetical protein
LKNRVAALEREIDEVEEPVKEKGDDLQTISETVGTGIEVDGGGFEIREAPLIEPELTTFPEISEQPETTEVMLSKEDLIGDGDRPAAPEEQVIRTLEIWLENIKRRR